MRFFRGGSEQDIIIRRLRYKDAFAELRGREKQRVMHEIAAFAIQQDIFALSCADGDFVAEQRRDSAACKPRAVDDDFAADFSAVFCAQRIAAARLFRRRYFETGVQLRAVIHGVADCRYRESVRADVAARGRVQRSQRCVGNVLF